MVAFVAGPGGLRSLGDRRPLLGRWLASLIEHLLLVDRARYLGCLAGEVEVFPDGLLRGRTAAKGIVVECIVRLVELVAEAVVRLLEIYAVARIRRASRGRILTMRTIRRRHLQMRRPDLRRHRASARSRAPSTSGRGRWAGRHQSRRKTWRQSPLGVLMRRSSYGPRLMLSWWWW